MFGDVSVSDADHRRHSRLRGNDGVSVVRWGFIVQRRARKRGLTARFAVFTSVYNVFTICYNTHQVEDEPPAGSRGTRQAAAPVSSLSREART